MKKWFFAVGVIIIVVGVIVASAYSAPKEVKDYPSVNSVRQAWSVNANLIKGDTVWVEIRQGFDWPVGRFELDEIEWPGFGILYVGVDIIEPRGNLTIFLIRFGRLATESSDVVRPLTVLDINLTINGGGLDSTLFYNNNKYSDVGGIAQFSGTYTFTVSRMMPSREDPPSVIDIRKRLVTIQQPYTYLLPVGITVTAAGSVLMGFSFKEKPKTYINKRKRERRELLKKKNQSDVARVKNFLRNTLA